MIFAPAFTLVNARVAGEEGVVAHSLRVAQGRVAALGSPPRHGDLVVDLGGDFVFPGLVNAHEHLAHNSFPRLKWRSTHANVREWIEDFQPRFATDAALSDGLSRTMESRLLHGLVKNLLSGVTSVCHHDPAHPFLRQWRACEVVRRLGWSHSLGIDGDERVAASFRATPRRAPWVIHAAEGTDEEARGEYARLEALGCIADNAVLVHGLGLGPEDRRRMLARGVSLVWCPSSNLFLFGGTADVAAVALAGRLALGTDSRLSGARDLLEELKVARSCGPVEDRVLCRLVTSAGARILRLQRRAVLTEGEPADLAVVTTRKEDCHASLVESDRTALRLVMRRGRALLMDPALHPLFTASRRQWSPVRVDGVPKLLDAEIHRALKRFLITEPGLELQD